MANNKSQAKVVKTRGNGKPVDWEALLGRFTGGKTIVEYAANCKIFAQGDPADSLFYLRRGNVKIAVKSEQGKEAIVATLGPREFLGEGCLAGQPLRITSAIAMTDCSLARVEKALMAQMLHERQGVSEQFVTHLLSRNIRFEGDLVDQLFNSSERRLARILLLLANFGKENRSETVYSGIGHDHLAKIIGTTRSRVGHFMDKFKKLGFVDFDGPAGGLTVNNGLLSVVLND